jgi:hypothetical protein
MNALHRIPVIFLVAVCFVCLTSSWFVCPKAFGGDNSQGSLSEEDRRTLNEYLGNGVVGDPAPAPVLSHGLNDLISLADGLKWKMRVTSGTAHGREQFGSGGLLNRRDGGTGFRFDTGDGRNVLFGQLDKDGNLNCFASQDNQEGVISRFSPAQPIFLANMTPGEARHISSKISVSDLSRPGVESHSGKLEIEFTYLGACRLKVPAGTIDSVLFKTHLSGNVGPASVDDTIYRFFAKNCGPVAVVETNDVSAFLLYNEKTRVGKVLVETILK